MERASNKKIKDNLATNSEYFVAKGVIEEITESIDLVIGHSEDGVEARVTFIKDYLEEREADNLYQSLIDELDWQQREGFNNFGGVYPEPRLTYWFGKPYKYSTVEWGENNDWHPKLKNLRERLSKDEILEIDKRRPLNSVMCNYYRDGYDSIGWHADDETSLGRCPVIASISLGETRYFDVCKREEYYARQGKPMLESATFGGCTKMFRFHLNHGSLLLMSGSVQDDWLHRVPKANKGCDKRINLTFRYIVDKEEELKEIQRKKDRNRARRLQNISPPTIKQMSGGKPESKTEESQAKVYKKKADKIQDQNRRFNDQEDEENKKLSPKRKKNQKDNEVSKSDSDSDADQSKISGDGDAIKRKRKHNQMSSEEKRQAKKEAKLQKKNWKKERRKSEKQENDDEEKEKIGDLKEKDSREEKKRQKKIKQRNKKIKKIDNSKEKIVNESVEEAEDDLKEAAIDDSNGESEMNPMIDSCKEPVQEDDDTRDLKWPDTQKSIKDESCM